LKKGGVKVEWFVKVAVYHSPIELGRHLVVQRLMRMFKVIEVNVAG
jgi:hypothetical protein